MKINKVGLVGGGIMGAAIAQVVVSNNLSVIIHELNEQLMQKAMNRIKSAFEREREKGKITAEQLKERMTKLSSTTSFEGFSNMDLVIEAVPEIMDIKKQVLISLERKTSQQTIFASNTSSLSISEVASTLKNPQRFIGLHFFNPPQRMKLVEVIPALQTSTETIKDTVNFARLIGRDPVVVTECAGFLVNRLLVPYLNEAGHILLDGSAGIEDIDRAAMQFGFPMGPFRLCDFIGIDTLVHTGRIMEHNYGPRMKPLHLLEQMVNLRLLGDKSDGGFYKGNNQVNPDVLQLIDSLKVNPTHGLPFTPERLIYPMLNEAVICLLEKVSTISEIDFAMMSAIGFPRDKGGPLRYADIIGLDKITEDLELFAQKVGFRFWPSYLLRKMVAAGFWGKKRRQGFYSYDGEVNDN